MAYCFMAIEKIKTPASFTRKMEHNYRLEHVPNADPNKSRLNEELIEIESINYYEAFKKKISEANHVPRKNAVLGLEVVSSYNFREVGPDFDFEGWKKGNVEWLKKTFGEENVVSAVLHMDEAGTAHIHSVVIPMHEGKLSAKHYLAGRLKMIQLQDSYGKAMQPYGLERGMKGSMANHKDIRKFYDELNREEAKKLPLPYPGETAMEYKQRADDVYLTSNIHHMDERLKMERKIAEAKTSARKISVDEKLAFQNEMDEFMKARESFKSEKEAFEKDKRDVEEIRSNSEEVLKKIKNFDLIAEGLKNHPDKKFTKQLGFDINKLIRWENEREKEIGQEEIKKGKDTGKKEDGARR